MHTHTFSTHSDHAGAITGGPDPTAYCRNLRECARSCSVHQVERQEDDAPTSCGGVLSSAYLDKNVYIQYIYIYIYIYIFERCAGCNHLEQCWFQHLENSKNTYCQFLSYIHMYKFLSMHMYVYIYECVCDLFSSKGFPSRLSKLRLCRRIWKCWDMSLFLGSQRGSNCGSATNR